MAIGATEKSLTKKAIARGQREVPHELAVRLTGTFDGDRHQSNCRVPRLGKHVAREQTVLAEFPLVNGKNEDESDSNEQRSQNVGRVPRIYMHALGELDEKARMTDKDSCPRSNRWLSLPKHR